MPTSLTVCICIYVYERVCVCEFPCVGSKCCRRRRRRHTLYLLNQPLKLLAQILLIFALYATKERAPKREPTERKRESESDREHKRKGTQLFSLLLCLLSHAWNDSTTQIMMILIMMFIHNCVQHISWPRIL